MAGSGPHVARSAGDRLLLLSAAALPWSRQACLPTSGSSFSRCAATVPAERCFRLRYSTSLAFSSFALVAQRGVADSPLGGDLRQRAAFQPVTADQPGLPGGQDAAAHGGGQHEIRVPPGQARAVAPEAEAAAAGGVAGVGAGEGFLRAAGPWQWFGAGGRASAHGPPRQCPHMRGGKKRWPFGQCWPGGRPPGTPGGPRSHSRSARTPSAATRSASRSG
jgi:hypothetical protein